MLVGLLRCVLTPVLLLNAASGQSPKIGEPAPRFSLDRTIPAGVNATPEALRGKPVVIEFWGTWCANCVAEIPRLNELVTKFPGIQFLSITDEQLEVVEPFLTKHRIRGLVGLDSAESTFKAYGIEGRPQTALIDKDGILRGIMHPAQVTDAVLADLVAGKSVAPAGLKAHLRMFEGKGPDPVFAIALRPSGQVRRGGNFSIARGALQGDNLSLKTIISYAYAVSEKRLEGPSDLLGMRYDFCVLLPEGVNGDESILRDMLERTLRPKIRREARQMDVLVLRLSGTKPRESQSANAAPINVLVSIIEGRLKRMVIDNSGLSGRYMFRIPENSNDLVKSLREQLGLEISPERRSVEFLVLDSLVLPAYRR